MLTVCPHRGHLLCTHSNTLTVFLSPPSSHCARGACVLFFLTLTVLVGCAWEPQCLTLMIKVSSECITRTIRTLPRPHLLSVCWCVSQNTLITTGIVPLSHFISSHLQTQGSISVHCFYLLASLL